MVGLLFEPRLRAEMFLRFVLYDSDKTRQSDAQRWQNLLLELLAKQERAGQAYLVADLFEDIRVARNSLAETQQYLAELRAQREEARRKTQGATPLESPVVLERVNQEIRNGEAFQEAYEERLLDATTDLKRLLHLEPVDGPIDFVMGDEEETKALLKQAGADQYHDLVMDAAEARVEYFRRAIPGRFSDQINLETVVNLARVAAINAVGPLAFFNILTRHGIVDPQREAMQRVELQAFAQAVYEWVRTHLDQELDKAAVPMLTGVLRETRTAYQGTAQDLDARLADIRGRVDQVGMDKVLTLMREKFQADLDLLRVRREVINFESEGVKFEVAHPDEPHAVDAPRVPFRDRLLTAIGVASNFPSGITRVKLQIQDSAGNGGNQAEIAVRVP